MNRKQRGGGGRSRVRRLQSSRTEKVKPKTLSGLRGERQKKRKSGNDNDFSGRHKLVDSFSYVAYELDDVTHTHLLTNQSTSSVSS